MHLDVYEPICFKLDMVIDTIEFYILILSDLDLGSRSQEYEKAKSSATIDLYEHHMDVCSESCSAGLQAIRPRGKNFSILHCTQTLLPNFSYQPCL